jgi:hypothetical protein
LTTISRDPCQQAVRTRFRLNDFLFDTCANDQQLKRLAVINEFIRECLAIDAAWPSIFWPCTGLRTEPMQEPSSSSSGNRPEGAIY